jgi:hypothetical protein
VQPITELVATVAAYGLSGARSWPEPDPLDSVTFTQLLDQVQHERLLGHLVAAIEAHHIPVSDDQHELALDRLEAALSVDVRLERLLVETSRNLTAAGIAHRALKGPVLARTAYRDPSLRSFADIDLLIERAAFDATVRLLSAEGGVARFLEPQPGFTRRFGKGLCVQTNDGLELDLHRVFCSGPFGLAIDDRDLLDDPRSIDIGGVTIPCLGPTLQFLNACYHAALGGRRTRLTAHRDVAELAGRSDFDLAAAVDVAAHWRGRAVIAAAAHASQRALRVDQLGPLLPWAAAYEPDRFERAAMRVHTDPYASYASQATAAVWAVRGLRPRAAYLRALLLPSPAYLEEREGTYRRRLAHAVSLARSRSVPR